MLGANTLYTLTKILCHVSQEGYLGAPRSMLPCVTFYSLITLVIVHRKWVSVLFASCVISTNFKIRLFRNSSGGTNKLDQTKYRIISGKKQENHFIITSILFSPIICHITFFYNLFKTRILLPFKKFPEQLALTYHKN